MLGPLDTDNQSAFAIYALIGTQLTYDLHVAPILLERITAEMPDDEVFDLFDRLNRIHRTMQQIAKDHATHDAEARRT